LTNLWDVDIRASFLWRAVPARLIRKPTPEENIALRGFFWVGKSYSPVGITEYDLMKGLQVISPWLTFIQIIVNSRASSVNLAGCPKVRS
jgi:hypothetical protein